MQKKLQSIYKQIDKLDDKFPEMTEQPEYVGLNIGYSDPTKQVVLSVQDDEEEDTNK